MISPLPESATARIPTNASASPGRLSDVFKEVRSQAIRPDLSPLRYPGGKRKLAVLIAHTFALSQRPARLLVEPFAGGAAVSLALLEAGFVERIALSDSDDLVASFWKTVFSRYAEQLASMTESTDVTLEQRDIIRRSRPTTHLQKAFKCLYLNRTSFSGIINERAGPLGGRRGGIHEIDCRFNKHRIAGRIRELGALRNRVLFVRCQDYHETIQDVRGLVNSGMPKGNVFWYLDPPFFEKADRLYRRWFDAAGHQKLRENLSILPGSFVLSYDDVPAAQKLYGHDRRTMAIPLGRTKIAMAYTTAEGDCRQAKELIVSDLLVDVRSKLLVHNRARAAKSR